MAIPNEQLLHDCFDRALIDLTADAAWLVGEGVQTFADLHDHFDANELGIHSIEHDLWQDDPLTTRVLALPTDEQMDLLNALHARVDAWIRGGHLESAAVASQGV